MSIYHRLTQCPHCDREITAQSLKAHIAKCTRLPANECIRCGKGTNNLKFCSRSCRAIVVNKQRPKKPPKPDGRIVWALREQAKFERGEVVERLTMRKHLIRRRGNVCSMDDCEVSDWRGKPLTLIVDHIDGNAGNNLPSNLRLLCPNCNSQTDTFGGRNKGNGRKARGLDLH